MQHSQGDVERGGTGGAEDGEDPAEPPVRRGRGRPRDERAERAILGATLEIVGEVGLNKMTIAAVAARAGVGKATIYRRWATKTEMVLAAFAALLSPVPAPDTGTVRGDLVAYQRALVRMLLSPGGDTWPHLAAEALADEAMKATLTEWVGRRRLVLREVLERGVARGELRADVDLDLALELFSGPVVYRLFWAGRPLDDQVAEELVDLVLDGLRS